MNSYIQFPNTLSFKNRVFYKITFNEIKILIGVGQNSGVKKDILIEYDKV